MLGCWCPSWAGVPLPPFARALEFISGILEPRGWAARGISTAWARGSTGFKAISPAPWPPPIPHQALQRGSWACIRIPVLQHYLVLLGIPSFLNYNQISSPVGNAPPAPCQARLVLWGTEKDPGAQGHRGGYQQSKSKVDASEIQDFLSSINASWHVPGCFPCPWSSPECPVLPSKGLGAGAHVWAQHSLHPRLPPSLSLQTPLTSAKILSTKPNFEVRHRRASRHWWRDIDHQVLLQLTRNRIRIVGILSNEESTLHPGSLRYVWP